MIKPMNENEYNPKDVEKKWQEYWDTHKTYKTLDQLIPHHTHTS